MVKHLLESPSRIVTKSSAPVAARAAPTAKNATTMIWYPTSIQFGNGATIVSSLTFRIPLDISLLDQIINQLYADWVPTPASTSQATSAIAFPHTFMIIIHTYYTLHVAECNYAQT